MDREKSNHQTWNDQAAVSMALAVIVAESDGKRATMIVSNESRRPLGSRSQFAKR
jgi:hypothetical protein